ncbi:hypothetical protein [Bacteroides sp.]|nr:hypothetical protein [Bacteroides sp.]MDD3036522.1 hypothetical protein [Bacteroides sp.]
MKTKRLHQLLLLMLCTLIWTSCNDNENLPDSPRNGDKTKDTYIAYSVQ